MGAIGLGTRNKDFLVKNFEENIAEREKMKGERWIGDSLDSSCPNSTILVQFYLFYILEFCAQFSL